MGVGSIFPFTFGATGQMLKACFLNVWTTPSAPCETLCYAQSPHAELIEVFHHRPVVAFAVWRETLIDAAIFREAITNNRGRPGPARLAHLFSEFYYRMRLVGLARKGSCDLPFSQTQLGELLGMSMISTQRHLAALRAKGAVDFAYGRLTVHDPKLLAAQGDFDPLYLHGHLQTAR